MRRVLLVCGVHSAMGVATAAELYWLLRRLRPDVLFLEHSPHAFSAFLDGSCGTLESAAVMRYRSHHAVELVPVDLHLPVAELKPKVDSFFDRIEQANPRFCELQLVNRHYTEQGGFAYLNSPTSVLLQSEMRGEIHATVGVSGEPSLVELYELWTHMNDRREMAMLDGVEAFARQASFKKGVLLVGAAHRQPLLEKSQLVRSDGPSPVTWEFDWQLEDVDFDGDAGPGSVTRDRGAPS